jgi:hypothetical protein
MVNARGDTLARLPWADADCGVAGGLTLLCVVWNITKKKYIGQPVDVISVITTYWVR